MLLCGLVASRNLYKSHLRANLIYIRWTFEKGDIMKSLRFFATALATTTSVMAQAVPPVSEAPATTWSVFGMDSTAGVMIGLVLMLVFILAIVAVSRSDRTTIA